MEGVSLSIARCQGDRDAMLGSSGRDVARDPRDDAATRRSSEEAKGVNQQSDRDLSPGERVNKLLRAIETEVIPRLVLAQRSVARPPPRGLVAGDEPSDDEVSHFANLVVARDFTVAAAFVEGLRTRGLSTESLFLDLLSPAARLLGEMWSADACDFTQVTVGLCRLQQVLHELSPAFHNEGGQEPATRSPDHRVLLAPIPGEQHTFGLYMVSEFFRRAGWDVTTGTARTGRELEAMVRTESYAVIGLSLSHERYLERLAGLTRDLRRHSRNRGVGILVGGPLFVRNPELVTLVGADATATDGREAVRQAEDLLALLPRHR